MMSETTIQIVWQFGQLVIAFTYQLSGVTGKGRSEDTRIGAH